METFASPLLKFDQILALAWNFLALASWMILEQLREERGKYFSFQGAERFS